MTTIISSAPAVAPFSTTGAPGAKSAPAHATAVPDSQKDTQRLAKLTGLLFLLTYASSIPPVASLYVPALSDPAFILGGGFNTGVSWGAILELVLILANVGTALTLYPVLRRRFPVLSLGFLGARIMESVFIAVGIVAILALNSLRLNAGAAHEGAMMAVGQALVVLHDWTFRLGPGVVVGVGNGIILGWMMWKTRLIPRALSILGLIGGPLLLAAGTAVILGVVEAGSLPHLLGTPAEFFWELGLGLWLVVKGFDPAAVAALDTRDA